MPIHVWTRVSAGIFHHFHHEWISSISQSLNSGLLPPGHYALAVQVAGGLGPDVLTLEAARESPSETGGNGSPEGEANIGGVALAEAPPKVRFTFEVEDFSRTQSHVAVRHVTGDEVVAIVEIVSPGNKASNHAIKAFVGKAVELLEAGVHLLILDLFPPTPRDPQGIHHAIWSELLDCEFELPPDARLTLVSYAAGGKHKAFVEPVAAGSPLPEMPLFFQTGRYIPLPLEPSYQEAFARVPERWRQELG